MPKVKLNLDTSDRITFKRTVKIPTPDGSDLAIEWEFRHRTRSELAKFIDDHVAQARADIESFSAEGAASDAAPAVREDLNARVIAREVTLLRGMAVGWDVDGYPFDEQSLQAFCDRYAGAASAVAADYRVSLEHGRLGN